MITEEIFKTEIESLFKSIQDSAKKHGFDFFVEVKRGGTSYCDFDESHRFLTISSACNSPLSWTIESIFTPDVR